MQKDLATAIIAAIAGVTIAYFVTNLFIPEISNVSFKTVSSSVNASIVEPDPEIFNYRALNPTVEVYVGECDVYDANGNCRESSTIESSTVEQSIIEPSTTPSDVEAVVNPELPAPIEEAP